MAESDEAFLAKYEPGKDEAFLAQYSPGEDQKFLEEYEPGLIQRGLRWAGEPMFVKETDVEISRIKRGPGIIAEETARAAAEAGIPGAAALGVFAASPAYLADVLAPIPQTKGEGVLSALFLGLPALKGAVISKAAGAIKLGDLSKMVGIEGAATADVGKPAATIASELAEQSAKASAVEMAGAEQIAAKRLAFSTKRADALKAAFKEQRASSDALRLAQKEEIGVQKTLEKKRQELFDYMARNPSKSSAAMEADVARAEQDLAKVQDKFFISKQRSDFAADRLREAQGMPTEPPVIRLSQAEVSSANRAAFSSKIADALKPEVPVAMPSATSGFPKSAGGPALSEDSVKKAYNLINPSTMMNAEAEETIAAISQSPEIAQGFMAQARGRVTRSASQRAGAKIGEEEFASLKPGEVIEGRTIDAQAAAAVALQNRIGTRMREVFKMTQSGAMNAEQAAEEVSKGVFLMRNAEAVKAELGRGLGAIQLTAAQKAERNMMRGALRFELADSPDKLAKFLQDMNTLSNDQVAEMILATKRVLEPEARTLTGMILEARGAALLTGISALRAGIGNTLAVMTRNLELAGAGTVDFLWSKLPFTSPQQRFAGEAMASMVGGVNGIKKAFSDGLAVIMNENAIRGFATEEAFRGQQIRGIATDLPIIRKTLDIAGKFIRFPYRLVAAPDAVSMGILHSGELSRLAYLDAVKLGLTGPARVQHMEKMLANPTKELLEKAFTVAKEYSFKGPLPKAAMHFQKVLDDPHIRLFTRFLVPFYKTPVKLAQFELERLVSPEVVRALMLDKNITKSQVLDGVAKMAVGWGTIGTAALGLKYKEGLITGAAPKDKSQRSSLEAAGWRPYSVKIGDLYINARGLEPLSSPLAMVADYMKFVEENPGAEAGERGLKLASSMIRNFMNQPFLKGISDLMQFIENPEGFPAKSRFIQFAASIVPTGLAIAARSGSNVAKHPETWIEAMMARTPILQNRVRPRLTKWGEPKINTSFAFGLLDDPRPATDPIELKLRSLGLAKVVGFPSDRIGGGINAIRMNADEYNAFLTLRGKQMRGVMEGLIKDENFDRLPQYQQLKLLEKYEGRFTSHARDLMRPRVVLRGFGINDQLRPEELAALNQRLLLPDFWLMEKPQAKAALMDFIKEVKSTR